MTRPAAIAVVLLVAGIAGVIAWWRVEPPPFPALCPDGGPFVLGADGVARCGEGAPLPPGQALTLGQKFDCNRATAADFALLPGFGSQVAADLVGARPDGGFTSWDEIDAVTGIGPARLNSLQAACELSVRDAGVW
jgi:competence protein ComEA